METTKEQALVIRDESGTPISVVVFRGKDHFFYSVERMGLDEISALLDKTIAEKVK